MRKTRSKRGGGREVAFQWGSEKGGQGSLR